jgi:uncharacterized SAM-binding protein YcdF (DUF218 family)
MFFILSKTLNYLIQPLVIIGILVLVGILFRKERVKKFSLRAAIILFFFFSNDFIANEFARMYEEPVVPLAQITKKYDYGILLTGIARNQVGPADRVYFGRGADRLTHTLQLYTMGIIDRILISGGSGRLIDIGSKEADQLKGFLLTAGVPDSVIVIENQSDNTYQSAVEVKKILGDIDPAPNCLLITSGYHLPRANACFEKAGIHADQFATDPLAHDRVFTPDVLIVPTIEAFAKWQSLLKEWFGLLAYKLAGYI